MTEDHHLAAVVEVVEIVEVVELVDVEPGPGGGE
jgi:hypothetical protein